MKNLIRKCLFHLRIDIGGNENTLINVHRKVYTYDSNRSASTQNILSGTKPLKFVVELTREGEIQVFSSQNPFVPLIRIAETDSLTPIGFISFASVSLSHFVYDVNEEVVAKKPLKRVEAMNIVKHPLLATRDYPIGFSEFCKCFQMHSKFYLID